MLASWFLPRDLHPAAWWVWALGLAVAASRTTNPWLLLTIVAVLCHVVIARRADAPWAMAFRMYAYLAAVIIGVRVFFRIVFGGAEGSTIILRLPEIPLPAWAAGIRLLGDVSAESVLGGLYDGLRLATMVLCLGAANALANPKRLLKAMPPALYEVGTAVIVALSVFPQLAESVQRVHRARKLRGGAKGRRFRALHAVVIPVLEDALDRSLQLASSMDSRGYGRAGVVRARARLLTGVLMITGLIGVCVGVYATLDGSTPRFLATPFLVGGLVLGLIGFRTMRHARAAHPLPAGSLAPGRVRHRRERCRGGRGVVHDVECGPDEPQPVAEHAVLAAAVLGAAHAACSSASCPRS